MLLIGATLLGGLGLFMLAVTMITDGLKLAAGDTLRDILGQYTRTPLRGVASGMLVTAVVQSSSAVTVATIGFVNAGLLTLGQSLGVIYGANVGTTMTGWLVASVGLGFKLEAFALPLIGIGMAGRLLGRHSRFGALGEALAGFGLFFVGIDVLQGAFEEFSGVVDVAALAPDGSLGLALYVAIGVLMTVLTQSSSAAIALTLTAATGGTVALDAAAAMVIGANIGTTSTAAMATIGATSNARRVAVAHVIFNGVTGLVALLLVAPLLWSISRASSLLDLEAAPAITLALFHTSFNLLGVIIMLPLTARLAAYLARRFVTREEVLARPRYLDRTVAVAPSLAIEALMQELLRAITMARELAGDMLGTDAGHGDAGRTRRHGLRGLLDYLQAFVAELETEKLTAERAGQIATILRISNYLEDVAALSEQAIRHRNDIAAVNVKSTETAFAQFNNTVALQIDRCVPDAVDLDLGALDAGFAAAEQRWHDLKSALLDAAGRRELSVTRLNGALDGLRSVLRVAEQLTKATRRQATLGLVQADSSADPRQAPGNR